MKRLFGIRHIRYIYLRIKLLYWWRNYGQNNWLFISDNDWDYLDRVWCGEE
jgi:hypothetical protein